MIPDHELRMLIAIGRVLVKPLYEEAIQPSSLDVHLGEHGQRFRPSARPIDLSVGVPSYELEFFTIPRYDDPIDARFNLLPGEFIKAEIEEYVSLDAYVGAKLDGKSTLGRVGLFVHVTAGLIDPGWHGRITVELFNGGPRPVRLWYGMPIGQLEFTVFDTPVANPYDGKYQGDIVVTGARPIDPGPMYRQQ